MCKVSCLSRVSIKLIDLLIVCNFWLLPSSDSIPQNNHRHCLWRYGPLPNMAALVMIALHLLASISMGEWWAAVCKSVAISPWILFVCLVLKVKTLSGGFMQMSPCNLHTLSTGPRRTSILTTFAAMDPMSCHVKNSEVSWGAKYDFKPLERCGLQCICGATISTWIHSLSPFFVRGCLVVPSCFEHLEFEHTSLNNSACYVHRDVYT